MKAISKEEFLKLVEEKKDLDLKEESIFNELKDRTYVLFSDEEVHKAATAKEVSVIMDLRGRGGLATRVAHKEIGPYIISTVFLSMDANWGLDDEPRHLFETMIFKDKIGLGQGYIQNRYPSFKEAQEGHKSILEWFDRLSKCLPADIVSEDDFEREIVKYFYNKRLRSPTAEATGSKSV